MSNSIITITARNKMLRARAGEISLPKIVGFVFGNGGVDTNGTVLTPSEDQTTLNGELLRKVIDSYTFVSSTKCMYQCTLQTNELVGESISEIALYDEDGDLVAIKNFMSKGKDSDLEMTFQMNDEF